ncbi:hypothetical protein [Robertmurraya andreesenii]|uniref:CRISPR-associated protein n=1 Tax=Anoxybacillus andreesenii TaxID=1325932 RepID=A0ABT9V8W9_9BACL|nr:hypothetical protein [Robertmurraya andreesenii]MDQ0157391.1 hypothetical protein [Robertmurraya andreesenii]
MKLIWVEKITNSYSDCLKAFGIASILKSVINNQREQIFISDSTSHYLIELPHGVLEDWEKIVEELEPFFPLPVLKNDEEVDGKTSDASTIYLKKEKERREVFQIFQKDNQGNKQNSEGPPPEHDHYHIYSLYQGMKVITAHNKMAETFQRDPELLKVVLEWIFRACTSPLIDSEERVKVYKEIVKKYEHGTGKKVPLTSTVNALSFFNPMQAKGVNNQSSAGISPSGVKSFVLDEFFKMVGVLHSSIGRLVKVGTRSYDCMLQTIEPQEIQVTNVSAIVKNIKTKIKAPSRTYLEFSTLSYTISEILRFLLNKQLDLKPSLIEYARGLYCTYFKDLGNAKAVMNLSYYHLPSWVKFGNHDDVGEYNVLFDDLISKCEKIRRDENLLQDLDQPLNQLVTFISSGRLESLLFFVQEYHFKVFASIYEKKYWLKLEPFSVKQLQEVIMKSNQPFSKIVKDDGFINLSRAIFSATLGLQYQDKSIRKYPVHYDLQHRLKQNAPYAEKFIATLTDFASTFNNENARVFESNRARGNTGPTRKNITDKDLASVIQLIDEYGSNVVGNLLVAFGYAKKDKTNEVETDNTESYIED